MVKQFKYSIPLFIMILFTAQGISKKITFGGALRYPVNAELTTANEITYFFADDVNSVYSVQPDDRLQPRSLLFPEIYGRMMFNDNIFIRYNIGYLSYLKNFNSF